MGEIKTTVKDVVTELIDKYETPIDPIKFNIEMKEISKLLLNKTYLLLICPDLRQYVFIHIKYDIFDKDETNIEKINKTLKEILLNRGQIVIIDRDNEDQGVWEIWIRDKFDGNLYFYQLIDYTEQTVII